MVEGDGERNIINDRMASELERVAFELQKLDQPTELDTRRSDHEGEPSSFSPVELAALQTLLDREPEDGKKKDASSASVGTTLSCGGEAYSSVGHSAVVTGDGRIFIWGSGEKGRLGRKDTEMAPLPLELGGLLSDLRRQGIKMKAVSCGFDHSACITEDGRVLVWGSGDRGQLGLGSSATQFEAAQVGGALADKYATLVSCGRCHTAVVSSDGELFTFGQGDDGQLGNGANKDSYLPLQLQGALAGQRVTHVSAGAELTACVIGDTGALYTWGSGLFGQLGVGGTESTNRPTKVAGLLANKRICRVACGMFHVLALDEEGCLYSWGDASCGQLGHGDNIDQLEPRRVLLPGSGLDATPITGTTVCSMSAAAEHSACVTTDGRLFTWGGGAGGKLGHGDADDDMIPRQVGGELEGKKVVDVACAAEHTICITHDGKVYAWGRAGGGQLGVVDLKEGKKQGVFAPLFVEGVVASTGVVGALRARRARPPTSTTTTTTSGGGGSSSSTTSSTFKTVVSSRATTPTPTRHQPQAPRANVQHLGGEGGETEAFKLIDGVIEKVLKVDGLMGDLEGGWLVMHPTDASYPAAVHYLLHRMNVKRDLSPMHDAGEVRRLAYSLWRYRNKITEPDAQDLKFFAEQTGLAGSSAERWRPIDPST